MPPAAPKTATLNPSFSAILGRIGEGMISAIIVCSLGGHDLILYWMTSFI
jgi:hypothetical protein